MNQGSGRSGGRPTLRTVAEATGLSLSTVSLSLRGGKNLREDTRRRVEEAARALGYVPDHAGVRLRTGRTHVIALVLDRAEGAINHARHLIQGIGEALRDSRYHLVVLPEHDREASVDTIRRIVETRSADGVLVTHTSPFDPRVRLLIEGNLPFVSHGRTRFEAPHPWIDFPGEAFARLAVGRLAAQGCRSVLLVASDDGTMNHQKVLAGFAQGLAEHDLAAPAPVAVTPAGGRTLRLRDLGCRLATTPDRPDGIVCDNEVDAMALTTGLRQGGAVVGVHLRVVCKQTSDVLPVLFPEIDGIVEDVRAAGREMTHLLVRRVGGEPPEQLQVLVEPALR
jgi:LacI family transcriptional regulator